jgi:hypothetical protein
MNSKRFYKTILFALGFLLAQSTVIFAEFSHPLHSQDSSCIICLSANHLSSGMVSENHIVAATFQHVLSESQQFYSLSLSTRSPYLVRAPPLSQA